MIYLTEITTDHFIDELAGLYLDFAVRGCFFQRRWSPNDFWMISYESRWIGTFHEEVAGEVMSMAE
jgi:hypothetical protein